MSVVKKNNRGEVSEENSNRTYSRSTRLVYW